MVLNITLPQLDKEKKAKDLVISVLAMNYPLSSKKIYNEIKRRFGYSVTYQAIHKSVLQLLEQGVLVKEDKEYSINMQWIDELINFVETMKENYETHKKYPFGIVDMQTSENMQMIVFSNFLGAELFNLKLLDKYCTNTQNKEPFCAHLQHIKRPIFQSGQAFQTLRIFKKTEKKKYILIRGDTFIDRWSADFYDGVFKCIFGVDIAKVYETYIYGDTVSQLYIPTEISKKIDFLYNNAKRIEDIKVPKIYNDIYEKKRRVQLLIYKNMEIAEQLRQKTLSYFDSSDASPQPL
ncbi:hypothetical protein HYY71_04205 [Candidatus Woesearchaeota archaeon]|nr:hypothetical protein [Candidatus Woesearchaeota archaeon]